MIHNTKKLKIDLRYDSRFDNYVHERDCRSERRREKKNLKEKQKNNIVKIKIK